MHEEELSVERQKQSIKEELGRQRGLYMQGMMHYPEELVLSFCDLAVALERRRLIDMRSKVKCVEEDCAERVFHLHVDDFTAGTYVSGSIVVPQCGQQLDRQAQVATVLESAQRGLEKSADLLQHFGSHGGEATYEEIVEARCAANSALSEIRAFLAEHAPNGVKESKE